MLPFLKDHKKTAGVIISQRKPDGGIEKQEEKDDSGLDACSEDLIRAINSKDIQGISAAIRAAFQILESEPHEEYEDEESPNTFESQNIKAGKESI